MPDLFSNIEGQETAKSFLESAVASRSCPPGYIFTGPPGVGKRTMALEVGRLLNCTNGGESSCVCPSCSKCRRGSHPDVQVFAPENQVFKVDTVREIRESARYHPYMGGWKVLVLEESEKMNPEASNAFLKVLEEPPGPTLFIMLNEGESPLPTIESRCISVPFFPLGKRQVQRVLLREGISGDVELESEISTGFVTKAMDYLRGDLKGERLESFRIFLALWTGKLSLSVQLMKDLGKKAEEVLVKLEHFQSFLRDLWLLKGDQEGVIRNRDMIEDLRPLTEYSSEVLAAVTLRTNEMIRLLGRSNLEVQLRAYLSSVLLSVRMEGAA